MPSFNPAPWQTGQSRVLVFAEVVMSGKPIILSIVGARPKMLENRGDFEFKESFC